MKSFIIYVKGHKESERQAKKTLSSCDNSGFDAELMEGITPQTVDKNNLYPDAYGARIVSFKKESSKVYNSKKSCFTNHIRVWKRCIELNEPVVFLEHDVANVRNWVPGQILFDEVLILNITSAFTVTTFEHIKHLTPKYNFGLNSYNKSPLIYHKENQWKGSLMIPGTASYAVTPKGAKRLLNNLDKYGWEQSDFFINSYNTNLQYVIPEYFTFHPEQNLNMSHGF